MKRMMFLVIVVLTLSVWSGCDMVQRTVTLDISTEGNGKVVAFPGEGDLPAGEAVLLIPKADIGWIFDAWIHSGQVLPTIGELTFILNEDYSITARFIQGSATITTLDYRLEADWSSFAKSDKMLSVATQSSQARLLGDSATSSDVSRFQKASYLATDKDVIPRERAILIKSQQGFNQSSILALDNPDWSASVSIHQNTFGPQFARVIVNEEEYDSIPTILQQLRTIEGIESAEEDLLYRIHSVPDDPFYSFQWNMEMLCMPAVWDVTTGEESVVVAVIDTGVYFPLDDLNRTQFTQGFDFVNDTINAFDDNGHGSHVTGTIAQSTDNGRGTAGMASKIKIMPVKVLDSDGYGFVSDVALGIIFAVNNGADIINLSLGGSYSDLIADACEYAIDHGVLVVASTGNDGIASISYPAALSGVLSVGAVNDLGDKTSYSNYGSGLDIMAPGGDFSHTLYNFEYSESYPAGILQETIHAVYGEVLMYYAGTSMAVPHVVGLAALIKAKNHSLTATQIEEIILTTADDAYTSGYDTVYGYGLINPVRALGITPYVVSDSINSSIDLIPNMKHRWRISAAEATIQASLSYLGGNSSITLCLEKPDGTILKEGLASGEAIVLTYEVENQHQGYLWLTVTVED